MGNNQKLRYFQSARIEIKSQMQASGCRKDESTEE
jgi:hypothetical protein